MNEKNLKKSLLYIIRIDVKNLFERITKRKDVYLSEFSLKRTREHFKDIFFNRYNGLGGDDLKYLTPELIILLDQFYSTSEELNWYLLHTQDMLGAVDTQVNFFIKKIKAAYEQLQIYLDSEILTIE